MRIHVVTSCTDRKKVPVLEAASMRSIAHQSLTDRARGWSKALGLEQLERHAAKEVYAGEHWTEFLALLGEHSDTTGWVISAGYGLVRTTEAIAGYAATFTPGHADSVRPSRASWSRADWWEQLGVHSVRAAKGHVRSITDLANTMKRDDQMVCVASSTYLQAVARDLLAAAGALGDANRVLVLGTRIPSLIRDHGFVTAVEYDSRLQVELGGSRVGLNIRVARRVLRSMGSGAHSGVGEYGRAHVDAMMSALPRQKAYEREPADDSEIAKFIEGSLNRSSQATASGLLRRWRDDGRACEQGRFRKLFRAVQEQMNRAEAGAGPGGRPR